MKNIILVNGSEIKLEERVARCNFCGERQKECIKSLLANEMQVEETELCIVPENPKLEEVIVGGINYLKSFFKTYRTIEDFDIKWTYKASRLRSVGTGKFKTETEYADICKDCIKQLAKLIK